MLVQYQMILKKEDVVSAINGEVLDVIEDLKLSTYLLKAFIAESDNSQVIEACESLKTFHEEIKELETIIANIRKNYEGFARSSLPQPEEPVKQVADTKISQSEETQLASLMEAINTLKQLQSAAA